MILGHHGRDDAEEQEDAEEGLDAGELEATRAAQAGDDRGEGRQMKNELFWNEIPIQLE